MLAGIESVGIFSNGQVELEADRREIYANILFACVSSYLTEASVKKE